jgi:hypothetical protein
VGSDSTTSNEKGKQGDDDDDDDLTDLSESDDNEAARNIKAERLPTRQSGRIAVKERPSMAEDQVRRNGLCSVNTADGFWIC